MASGCFASVEAVASARRHQPSIRVIASTIPRVALSSTVYTFEIQLSDVDRGVYEVLSLKAARHPSETEEHLATRVLAYCLEYAEGIAFSRGLANPDEPALWVRDLTGVLQVWIDIGAPEAARLHKAAKAAPRVAVYTHKDPAVLLAQLAGTRIHRAEALELYSFDRDFLTAFVSRLGRRTSFDLSVTDGHLFLNIEGATLSGELTRHVLPGMN
jgi:uncharacterized protein YaeQ